MTPAAADVRDFLGRPLADVRVEVGGQPLVDPAVVQLIETRVGEALSMRLVRETIDHLVGLGRFQDIRVEAAASPARADAVSLIWTLVPVQRIAHVEFTGEPALSASELRTEISERFGVLPAGPRAPEIVQALIVFYRDRGYQRPVIEPRLTSEARGRRRDAHARHRRRTADDHRARVGPRRDRSDAGKGDRRPEARRRDARTTARRSTTRLAAFATKLRDLGYYEARVTLEPTLGAKPAARST